MDFEQMQVIWDSQKEQQVYALDLDALHASVKRRGRGVARGVNAMEIGMVIIAIVTALALAADPLLEGVKYHELFGSALMLGVAAFMLVGRARRRTREQSFEPTLVGDLDRAISQIDYHILRVRTFQWWFLLPAALILLVSLIMTHESKSIWVWPLCGLAMAFGWYVTRLELNCVHLPRKRDLEALRAKLTDLD